MSSAFASRCILVVENNPTMLSLFRQLLNALGAGTVIATTSGEEAKAALSREPIDIVITDMRMEPVSGLDLVEWIRNDPASPEKKMPVIMASAYSDVEQVIAARNAGVDEFLLKPITVERLKKRLTAVIKGRRPFVRSNSYVGPCRRGRNRPEFEGDDRRQDQPETSPMAQVADDVEEFSI